MKRITLLLVALLGCGLIGSVIAQEAKPYTEGVVTDVSFIRIKPGQFDNYMKFLDGPYKAEMEALKKAGIVTRYAVAQTQARSPDDYNLVLTVSYPNMAALDKTDQSEAISAKVLGSNDEQNKATMDRGAMRDVLGGRLVRELVLK
ncbi:MAG: hypothetical protein ABJB02_02520 [Dokdonella sp.]